MDDAGIPWLTGHQRDFLAHLTTLTIQRRLKPERSYQRVSEALETIAADGHVLLRTDHGNVWVLILGRSIVHAERDWLEWASERWVAAGSN